MKNHLIYYLLFLCSTSVYSQSDRENINVESIAPKFISPQVADMLRYDQTEIALNSGRLDLQLAVLDKFSDKDFSFPISISYNSAGFKPNEPEGNVGLNWSLIFGGAIYREVRGIPDDQDEKWFTGSGVDLTVKGFLHLAKGESTNVTSSSMFSNTSNIDHNYHYNLALINGTDNIEASSDLYRFNFGNHSGKFVIDFNGSVKSIAHSGGKVKVDISDYLLSKNVQDKKTGKSEIRITTDNGYVYCFGGSYSAMEYTAFTWDERLTYGSGNPPSQNVNDLLRHQTITAFHLYKIIAPNGRTLKINYHTLVDTLPARTEGNTYHERPWNLFTYSYEDNNKDLQMCYLLRQAKYGYGNRSYESLALNKIALIESIELDNKKVRFYHSHKTNTLYDTNNTSYRNFTFGMKTGAKLDSICLYLNNNRIESTVFEYTQIGRRQFLSKILKSTEGNYNFSYYSDGTSVSPLTIDYDHWGYWNGSGTNNSLIVNSVFSPGIYDFQTGNRRPGDRVHSAALLYEITYPTGGLKRFTYEQHDCLYALQLEPSSALVSIPQMRSSRGNRKVGGSRIKQITLYDNEGSLRTKDFIYSTSVSDNEREQISSGELMYVPIYTFPWSSGSVFNGISSYGFNERSHDSDHVRYHSVLEYDNLERIRHFKGDSVVSMGVSPTDPVRKKTFTVNTLNVAQYWSIAGYGRGKNYGQEKTASLSIRKASDNELVKIYYYYDNWREGYNGDPVYGESAEDYKLMLAPNTEYKIIIECNGPADMMEGAWAAISISYKIGYDYNTVEPAQYKQTIFTNYGSPTVSLHPDNYNSDKLYTNGSTDGIQDALTQNLYKSITKKPQDRSIERGKIKEEKYYSKDGVLKKRITYNYRQINENVLSDYSVYVHTPSSFTNTKLGCYSQINKEYFYQFYLESKSTKEYGQNSNSIETKETYSYDSSGIYLKEKKLTNSDKITTKVNYYYAPDKSGTIYEEMINANIISPVIEKRVTTGSSVQKIITNYQKHSEKTHNMILSASVVTQINSESRTDLTYDQYDAKGNLQQTTDLNGMTTIYLWSYEGQYPIAEIKNATYAEVETAVKTVFSVNSIEELSNKATPNEVALWSGTLQRALPHAFVTTYTYKPLIGILSVYEPSGENTGYTYDASGRLKEIFTREEGMKRVIQTFEYNFKNQ